MVSSICGRFALIVTMLVLVSGCRTQIGEKALVMGNLDLAEKQATAAAQRGDPGGFNNLGVIALRRGNRTLAVHYYTIAARMGVPIAMKNLAELNEPIPPVEIAIQPQHQEISAAASALELVAAGVNGYNQGRSVAPQAATSGVRPLPAIPPLGTKKCASRAVVENGVTRWVQVCD